MSAVFVAERHQKVESAIAIEIACPLQPEVRPVAQPIRTRSEHFTNSAFVVQRHDGIAKLWGPGREPKPVQPQAKRHLDFVIRLASHFERRE